MPIPSHFSDGCWADTHLFTQVFFLHVFIDEQLPEFFITHRHKYFDFAASFLNNGISVQQLANAMRLGKLGEQIVIKSKYAFSLLHYDGFSIAEKEKYYVRRKARNDEADQLYSDILEEETDGLYILDIIRGGIQNDDPRIPRNLSE